MTDSEPKQDYLAAADSSGAASADKHRLSSMNRGESQVEILAQRIETRRANRILITMGVRRKFIDSLYDIAVKEGYKDRDRVHYEDLLAFRQQIEKETGPTPPILKALGFLDFQELYREIFARAEKEMNQTELKENGWFYYRDFMFYHTDLIPYWPILRNGTYTAILFMFAFYFATAVFFCAIVDDENICPADPDPEKDRPFYGWVSALYFASTTISTVGYGDLNVEKDPNGRTFYGVVYMILAMLMAILFFGAIAESAFSRLKGPIGKYFDMMFIKLSHLACGAPSEDDHLYVRIRRLRFKIISEVVVQFSLLNLFGVFVSRFFANNRADEEGEDWNWMTSLYWAVQTTTTIGYGDLTMPFEMRWFQILYLTLSTYFVGNALGHLGTLGPDILAARRLYAWERRKVSSGLVNDFNTDEFEDAVDQYEFAVASLLTLGLVSHDDLAPIMDKFRELAGADGYINVEKETEVKETNEINQKILERAKSRKLSVADLKETSA